MTLKNEILLTSFMFFLAFCYLRSFLSSLVSYQLNKSAIRKRKKGQNFIEWLLYLRYKDVITKIFILLYYSVLVIHLMCIPVFVLFEYAIEVTSFDIGHIIAISVFIFDMSWMLIMFILFFSHGLNYPFERWITKRRGQKPKKK